VEERADRIEARVETDRLSQRAERAPDRLDRGALARVDRALGTGRERGEPLRVHEAAALRREPFLLAGNERGALELGGLGAEQVDPLARDRLVRPCLVERFARGDEPRVAVPHLVERPAEAADRVEQLAMALHPPERLVLVLRVDPQEMPGELAQQG